MKAKELRQLNAEELENRLGSAQRELYELRFKAVIGQMENPHQIGRVRKLIARILTVASEPKSEDNAE
ncbi:MAG: 50S ribosomal protein L29 [Candidatus Dormibacteraceae bacterium]